MAEQLDDETDPIREAFLRIRALPATARAAGLDAIADPAIRGEVRSLIEFDIDDSDLLREAPAPDPDDDALTAPPPDVLGAVLADRYQVLAGVAEGGFGWVFRGRDVDGGPVAIKLFKPIADPAIAAQVEAAFAREAQVLADLADATPHIVGWRANGTWHAGDQRHPFIVLEWLDGPTLGGWAAEQPAPPTLDDALARLAPIAEALTIAHRAGVAHRDIKPSNILFDGPALKLVDFGAAKLEADRARGFESTGGQVGMISFRYAAPEQVSKAYGSSGPWSDVYALALVLVELCAGRHPFAGLDFLAAMEATLDPDARPTLRAQDVAVSDAVEAVVAKALAVEHAARYPDVATFWRALATARTAKPRRGFFSRLLGR